MQSRHLRFLNNVYLYWDIVNLFRVHLMAICKENRLKTLVSVSRCKRKPPYDTLFWVPTTGLGATKQRHP